MPTIVKPCSNLFSLQEFGNGSLTVRKSKRHNAVAKGRNGILSLKISKWREMAIDVNAIKTPLNFEMNRDWAKAKPYRKYGKK